MQKPSPLLSVAARIEAGFERVFNRKRAAQVIEPYIGYATPEHLIVRGRVHDSILRAEARPEQGRLANLRQMIGMFRTSEVPHAPVACGPHETMSDDEGYFRLAVPRAGQRGWCSVEVTLQANGAVFACPVLATEPRGPALVISDIDDTIMKTGAYSLPRNLWTTFTGNAFSRQIFPDAAVLLFRLNEIGAHPVFYVSSSPWNLHYFLEAVFRSGSVVRGPLFLRDLGLSPTKLISAGHGSHKGRSIDTILDANPQRGAVLIGDTGQKDAEIYRSVVERHPGRVRAVILRTPGPGLGPQAARAVEDLRATGVEVFCGYSFAEFFERIEAAVSDPA